MRIILLIFLTLFAIAFYDFLNKPSKSNEIIILRDSLDQSNKKVKYYEKQYLKANTQLIEIKQKCIYCAD